jgi:hypothetical protein
MDPRYARPGALCAVAKHQFASIWPRGADERSMSDPCWSFMGKTSRVRSLGSPGRGHLAVIPKLMIPSPDMSNAV